APDGKEFDAWEVRGKRQDVGAEILADSDFTVKALWKDKKVAPPADTKPEQQEPVKPNKPQTKPAKPNAKTGVNNMLSLASASTLLVTIGGTLFISKNRRKNNQ
ncbi:MAG: hypothetical protein Q4E28_04660, partial [Clostridia bacterium]|nr:hypothetical protein [Clostridia bacterium]